MKTELQDIKTKLVKLINLSENGAASQGEIDNALNMAARIMAKHNLTRDDIDLTSSQPTKNVRMSRAYVSCLNSNSTTWEGNLASFCVEFIGNIDYYKTNGFYSLDKSKKITVYFFYGSLDEVEIAIELFTELQEAIYMMAMIRFQNFYSKKGGSYCEGFIEGLEQSYHTEKLKLRGDEMTNALMIKSNNTSLMIKESAKDWLYLTHKIKLRMGQGTSGASGGTDARTIGKKDGSNYSIGKRSNTKKIG
jgi:hypothetical protein